MMHLISRFGSSMSTGLQVTLMLVLLGIAIPGRIAGPDRW